MVSIKKSLNVRASSADVFDAIENVQKLARFKREIKNFKLVRDETGLQLLDVQLRFLGIAFSERLKYTTIPRKYAELKGIKGKLKEYTCAYTILERQFETEVVVSLAIRFPYLLFGFIFSLFAWPLCALRVKKELSLLRKYFKEK
ncbi:MAG: hypothetical protein N2316_10370 [Spirochaetes bacterium]|nr:hypothetical protein [Spirochaetota bacterium]